MSRTLVSPVSLGNATRKADYDALWDNADLLFVGHNDDGTHKIKMGSTTHDISVTGDQAITGVGFQPKVVLLLTGIGGKLYGCIGIDDGTTPFGFFINYLSNVGVSASASISLTTGSGNVSMALVSSMDADGFTLTWSKIGSPSSDTATIAYLALP